MDDPIERHCAELNRCNQRGGRMLSVFDLLDAETLNLELAAYLMARISRGASFMVGAVPGGAGKTTVMCALLNFVPARVSLIAAAPQAVYGAAGRGSFGPCCYVCHEIGSGPYYAYLWSDALRSYCGLAEQGHMLATNLHADDIDEAIDQVCRTNGVPSELFKKFELLIFLRISGGYFDARRWIELVYSGNGSSEHELVFGGPTDGGASPILHSDPEYVAVCRDFLCEAGAETITIEQTRERVLEFLDSNSS